MYRKGVGNGYPGKQGVVSRRNTSTKIHDSTKSQEISGIVSVSAFVQTPPVALFFGFCDLLGVPGGTFSYFVRIN
jgi:hypothetical protein